MSDEGGNVVERGPSDLSGSPSTEVSASIVSGSVTGDQSLTYADVQIRIETAAHQRWIEQQRLEHELREEAKDNTWRRRRDIATFAVVTIVLVVILLGTTYVALTTVDPSRQTFAQGLATTIGGAIGGAFAGYAVAERRK